MNIKKNYFAFFAFILVSLSAQSVKAEASNILDEFDPAGPDINQTLLQMDLEYELATGESAFIQNDSTQKPTCYQRTCSVFIDVDKSTQTAQLFVEGTLTAEWKVSTGKKGHSTPNFEKQPNGRIYNKYTSSKYPGGDYMGLGNMPYAVFFHNGYAIHGTGKNNWKKLGTRDSHGCVRLHPDNAKIFNKLVREHGISNTWISIR